MQFCKCTYFDHSTALYVYKIIHTLHAVLYRGHFGSNYFQLHVFLGRSLQAYYIWIWAVYLYLPILRTAMFRSSLACSKGFYMWALFGPLKDSWDLILDQLQHHFASGHCRTQR